MPAMTFDEAETSVVAWTGDQYVGPCIPGFATTLIAGRARILRTEAMFKGGHQ